MLPYVNIYPTYTMHIIQVHGVKDNAVLSDDPGPVDDFTYQP